MPRDGVRQLAGCCSWSSRRGLDVHRRQSVLDRLPEQLVLIVEVEIDSALGDAGAAGNLIEGGVGDSGLAEDSKGRVEDLVGPVGGLSPPFRAFLDGCSY